MAKLIEAFRKIPSPSNRAKLQAYLNRHPFAIVCDPSAGEFLRANGFTV
jgi:hypothetical protein